MDCDIDSSHSFKKTGTARAIHMLKTVHDGTEDLKSTISRHKSEVYVGLLNRWLFKSRLKLARLFACLTLAGSLFHKVGAATENALQP